VADGGEIWLLDSANYNTATFNITKSVTILAVPGAVGSVVATGGPAISIAAAALNVALRNLVIVPLPASAGTDGISMTGASALTIEDSLIANLPSDGVRVVGTGTVKITNSTIRNSGSYGVQAQDGAQVNVSGVNLLNNNIIGVFATSTTATTTTAAVSNSVFSGGSFGVVAYNTNAGGNARVFVTRCSMEAVGHALESNANVGAALVTVSGSMVTNNALGWNQIGATSVIKSLGNNHIQDNTGNSGTLTPASLQ
jgi:hypothetical protein